MEERTPWYALVLLEEIRWWKELGSWEALADPLGFISTALAGGACISGEPLGWGRSCVSAMPLGFGRSSTGFPAGSGEGFAHPWATGDLVT